MIKMFSGQQKNDKKCQFVNILEYLLNRCLTYFEKCDIILIHHKEKRYKK